MSSETIFLDPSSSLDGVEFTGSELKDYVIDSIILKERLQDLNEEESI